MDRRIQICGMQLDNLTVDEILSSVEDYFSKGRLYVISYIYAEFLKLLVQDEQLRETVIENADLILIGEKAVAEVLEEPCALTDAQLDQQHAANRILEYCAANGKTIYWIGESESAYETFRAYVDKQFAQLQVVGGFATGSGEDPEMEEEIVNDINRVSPDVILSKLPSPYQEQFVARQRLKVNGQVWLGLSDKTLLSNQTLPASSKIKAMIDKTLLRRAVNANKTEE